MSHTEKQEGTVHGMLTSDNTFYVVSESSARCPKHYIKYTYIQFIRHVSICFCITISREMLESIPKNDFMYIDCERREKQWAREQKTLRLGK